MKSKVLIFATAVAAMILGPGAHRLFAQQDSPGAVYTASNAADANSVLVFARSAQGDLSFSGAYATGGLGTGGEIDNQGALVLSSDNRWLFVVNAGSDDISTFEVLASGLKFAGKVSSGGKRPISLTVDRDLLYVLNSGGIVRADDNITGFRINTDGKLLEIPGSTRHLSGSTPDPVEVRFSPKGNLLVVTEIAANVIETFTVDKDGFATGPHPQPSSGITPFGFAFGKRDQFFVSEASGGAENASSLSSYKVDAAGLLQPLSARVPTHQSSACWTVVTNDGRFGYLSNTGSGTITGFSIAFDGTVALLQADGVSAKPGALTIDAALSNNDQFLFTLNAGTSTITGYKVGAQGDLTQTALVPGIPVSANGLAAR